MKFTAYFAAIYGRNEIDVTPDKSRLSKLTGPSSEWVCPDRERRPHRRGSPDGRICTLPDEPDARPSAGLPGRLGIRRWHSERSRSVGNAVAPVVAQAVGLTMYSALQGMEFDWEAILRLRHRREIDPPPLAPSTDDMTADPGVEVVPGLNSPASAFFSIVTSEAITFSHRIIPR